MAYYYFNRFAFIVVHLVSVVRGLFNRRDVGTKIEWEKKWSGIGIMAIGNGIPSKRGNAHGQLNYNNFFDTKQPIRQHVLYLEVWAWAHSQHPNDMNEFNFVLLKLSRLTFAYVKIGPVFLLLRLRSMNRFAPSLACTTTSTRTPAALHRSLQQSSKPLNRCKRWIYKFDAISNVSCGKNECCIEICIYVLKNQTKNV